MKLTPSARLRIVSVVTAALLTAGIGFFLAESNFRDAIANIDSSINQTINDASTAHSQELSAALLHIEEFSLDLTLALYSRDGSLTIVNEATDPIVLNPTAANLAAGIRGVRNGEGPHGYRWKSLEISGGDYLIVAASSDEAEKDLRSSFISLLFLTAGASLLTFFLATIYIRRLKRREDADALARMQSFLGDASHELRTPLTVIKGYVELLSKGQMGESDSTRAFTRVSSEIARMESLIHDLLLLAELGESAQREREVFDLSELLKAYGADFKALHPERSVTFDIESEVDIEGVRDYLARFIQNALNNISRHTPSTAPVAISLKRNGKFIRLVIEDGGPGLPEIAYSEKIKNLTRFDPSRSRESGGSGLGMSIMAAVVEKCGGELQLRKSALGGLALITELPTSRG